MYPMISRTFRISRPYSSFPNANVKYLPLRALVEVEDSGALAALLT
jgi:hypothetical protein